MTLRRTFLAFVCVTLIGLFGGFSAYAGTITRGTKTTGTDWTSEILTAATLNYDFNTVYNLVNGNIDDANVKALAAIEASKLKSDDITNLQINSAADIVPTKIDDYSANDTQQLVVTNPGDIGTQVNAVQLDGEIATLRYAIRRLALGNSVDVIDGTDAASWMDLPIRGENLLLNNSFEFMTTAGTPDGWTVVSAPGTAEQTATAAEMGQGKELHTEADAGEADEIKQTLGGLKSETRYVIGVWAKAAGASDDCELKTSGAEGGNYANLALTTSATTYTLMAGIVRTDVAATDIDMRLVANVDAEADECDWDHAFAYETTADLMPRVGSYGVTDHDSASTTGLPQGPADLDVAGGDCVEIPGPGYQVLVLAAANADADDANDYEMSCFLEEKIGAAAYDDRVGGNAVTQGNTADIASVRNHWFLAAPTPGETYCYKYSCSMVAPDAANKLDLNPGAGQQVTVILLKMD